MTEAEICCFMEAQKRNQAESEIARQVERHRNLRLWVYIGIASIVVAGFFLPGQIRDSGWESWAMRVISGAVVSLVIGFAVVLAALFVLAGG